MTDVQRMMESICTSSNLNQAFRHVKRNKGAAGVDKLSIAATEAYLREGTNAQDIKKQLLMGNYQPQMNRGVKIPKAKGGWRQLGIPTVLDRWIQQSLLQILTPIYERQFSNHSYGFRPKRSAHDAIKQSSRYIVEGKKWVVDLDLERYFDTVNHDRLMHRLSKEIKDKRVLKLIRNYLRAGLLQDGIVSVREKGTPQGGPLSPLLSNLVLDELDKELERRGHRFCRYADDCNIYVSSRKAGERVMKSITDFIEKRMKLTVNREKSGCDVVRNRQFLGYRFNGRGEIWLSKASEYRLKRRVKELSYRNRGCSLRRVMTELKVYLRGWLHYFKLAKMRKLMERMDQWLRRRLRCYRLKQRKRKWPIARWLMLLGVKAPLAWQLAKSSKGWWRLSQNPIINQAMPNVWFKEQGMISLLELYDQLHIKPEPPYATNACTVV